MMGLIPSGVNMVGSVKRLCRVRSTIAVVRPGMVATDAGSPVHGVVAPSALMMQSVWMKKKFASVHPIGEAVLIAQFQLKLRQVEDFLHI